MAFAPLLAVIVVAASVWALVPWPSVYAWVVQSQRLFQNNMAQGLTAVRAGDMTAIWALCMATAAYGFVHALGPGHGKILLGGAALASGATLRRMAMLTVVSSLAQSGTAILLVGVLAAILGLTSQQLGPLADQWLAPLSYVAIASIGLYLVWRGMNHWWSHAHSKHHDHDHDHDHEEGGACCGHSHGPSVGQVESLNTARETVALVTSIALRPCTGAIFVLIIAMRFDVFWVGCLAVLAMGLGTAAFNLLVASSGIAARRLSTAKAATGDNMVLVAAWIQMIGGAVIVLFCALWLLRFWTGGVGL